MKKQITVQKRKIFGGKVKKLRREGILPGNIYGKKTKSKSIQLDIKTFKRIHKEIGETGVLRLFIEGEKEDRPVLISTVQYHPVSGYPLHVDFHQVDLKEKVEAVIPLRFVGESPAVEQKIGALFTSIDEIQVKSLPEDLPDRIDIDISGLTSVDQEIKVKDLNVDQKKIEILADLELIVAKIGPLVTKEAKELEKEEAAMAEEAKEEAKEAAPEVEEKEERKAEEETKEEKEEKKEVKKE